MNKKIIGVLLGRFAPFHLGHQKITRLIIDKHGMENTLLIIGSSNALTARTPYTFEQRKNLIQKIYPELNIIPLEDINPHLNQFHVKTLDSWLLQLEDLEQKLNAKFKFYGGSHQDLWYLHKVFEVEVLIHRDNEGENINSTKIRKLLELEEHDYLEKYVDKEIVNDLIEVHRNNLHRLDNTSEEVIIINN